MSELKSFDRVAHVYDETRAMPPEVTARVADAIACAAREVAALPRLLEVGIGTGRVAVPLAERGVRVSGADIAPKMLGVLRAKRADIPVLLAEATRLPFRDGAFDAALFVHVLHLVPDVDGVLREAVRVVHPGGAIIYGGDDHPAGIRREADAIVWECAREAGVDMGTRDAPHHRAMEAMSGGVLRDAGARLETIEAARWTGRVSVRQMLERLARRDYSSSWRIPEEKVAGIVEAARPRLEALLGGPDGEAPFERSFSLIVARLP